MPEAFIEVEGFRALRTRAFRRANPKGVTQELYKELGDLWHRAGAEFIKTAVNHMLIETGMSAASFFPLARIVKNGAIREVESYISRNRGSGFYGTRQKQESRKGIPTFPSGRRKGGIQNPEAGAKAGKKAFFFSVGKISQPVFSFVFQTAVWQFALNENRGNQHALREGQVAFNDFFIANANVAIRSTLREYLRARKVPGGERRS